MFTGMRGGQIAGQFTSLRTPTFEHTTAAQRETWARVVATMEDALRLHRHTPGSLVEMAPYLNQRRAEMIGSLDI